MSSLLDAWLKASYYTILVENRPKARVINFLTSYVKEITTTGNVASKVDYIGHINSFTDDKYVQMDDKLNELFYYLQFAKSNSERNSIKQKIQNILDSTFDHLS